MKTVVVAVRDSAVNAFARPVHVQSVGQAVRSFSDEVNRPSSVDQPNQMNQHPDDFELYHIADFDDETGAFTVPDEGVRMLARGKDLIRQ